MLATRLLISALCLANSLLAQDDPRPQWLREHAVQIRSIDPADDDFADLMPLADLIGDARVVGLGEQTHGDGATFRGKSRLIRFLHQEMGFDVLVWESGMFDCHRVEQALRDGVPMSEAWRRGIFPIWGMSEQVQPLFKYIDETRASPRPLEIAGTDSQMTARDSGAALRNYLRDLVEGVEADDVATAWATLGPFLDRLTAQPGPQLSEDDRAQYGAAVNTLIGDLDQPDVAFADLAARDRSFAIRTLRNLGAMIEMMYWGARARGERTDPTAMRRYANAREPAMAATLVWLAREYYPERKLIVWAASSHLTFASRKVEMPSVAGDRWQFDDVQWQPMGNHVRQELGAEFYVVDFIAYGGQAGSVAGWQRDLDPAPAGSIDAICHETRVPLLFIDLQSLQQVDGGAWLGERLVARPRGYAPMRAVWSEVCDAFFFTDTMYPSTAVSARGR